MGCTQAKAKSVVVKKPSEDVQEQRRTQEIIASRQHYIQNQHSLEDMQAITPQEPEQFQGKTDLQRLNELLFYESDVWELSGLGLALIKRQFVQIEAFAGEDKFNIRVATIECTDEELVEPETLVLCHDYMLAGCIQWHSYVKGLAKHFRLMIPDMGSYGANSRSNAQDLDALHAPEDSESLILEWFDKWVHEIGSLLPDKFHLAGFANGGFQAGLYASKNPDKVLKLLLLAPSSFCPDAPGEWNPYNAELNLSATGQGNTTRHIYDNQKKMALPALVSQLKTEISKTSTSLSKSAVKTIAEYRARILQDQDIAQVAYLRIFSPFGRSYNPLRHQSRLANPSLDFPVSVICGANSHGGFSECIEFIKVNKYHEDGQGLSMILVVPHADESLTQNIDDVITKMVGYFHGTLVGENEPKQNEESVEDNLGDQSRM